MGFKFLLQKYVLCIGSEELRSSRCVGPIIATINGTFVNRISHLGEDAAAKCVVGDL